MATLTVTMTEAGEEFINLSPDLNFGGLGYVNASVKTSRQILFLLIAIIGIVGNAFILIVHFKHRALKNGLIDHLLGNQSLADLVTSIVLLVTILLNLPQNLATNSWWDELVCRVVHTQLLLISSYSTSVYNLVTVSLFHHVQNVHPLFYTIRLKGIKARYYIGVIWFLGFGCNILFLVPSSGLANENLCIEFELFPSNALRMTVGILMVILNGFIPTLIMLYTLLCSLVRFCKLGNHTRNQTCHDQCQAEIASLKINAFFLGVLVLTAALNNVFVFLSFFHVFEYEFYSSPIYVASVMMLYSNCAIHPAFHAIYDAHLRSTLRCVFIFCCSRTTVLKINDVGNEDYQLDKISI